MGTISKSEPVSSNFIASAIQFRTIADDAVAETESKEYTHMFRRRVSFFEKR